AATPLTSISDILDQQNKIGSITFRAALLFFYNYSTGRCRPFTYSGCGGNENNFTSRKSCLRICRKGMKSIHLLQT
uniref:BPTI/Kunitz inhibitor domain-containing protein n=1 Tax=Pavo cristatus TaxID=9049 RepID=A0A8C9FTF9_PAVCR